MTTHTEWVRARDAYPEYAEHEDAHGTRSEGRALLIGNDSTVAIEGTPEELIQFARAMVNALMDALTTDAITRKHGDPEAQQRERSLTPLQYSMHDEINQAVVDFRASGGTVGQHAAFARLARVVEDLISAYSDRIDSDDPHTGGSA